MASSGAYWKERFSQLEASQNRRGMDCYADMESQYRQAQRTIEGQINSWYQRFADNNEISMSEARKLLNSKELAEFKWDVNDYIKYGEENAMSGTWAKQLENASARYHISRLEALKVQTQQSVETLFGNQLDSIDSAMKDIYTEGYYHTAFEVQRGVGVGWDFATLDDKQIDKVINKPWAVDGKNFSERIWENKEKLVNELNQTLTQNIILGQDPQKAIDAISQKLNVSKSNAGRLVMTEEAYFSSEAQKDCFDELDVEMYEIVATLDSHTSEICQEMDGKTFKMSEWEVGVTAPPFHPWCRSTTVPAFGDEFDKLGERAARDEETGQTYHVPADTTYKDWKKAFVDGDKSGLQQITPSATIDSSQSKADITAQVTRYNDMYKEVRDIESEQEEMMGVSYSGFVSEHVKSQGAINACLDSYNLTDEQKQHFWEQVDRMNDLNSQMEALKAELTENGCLFTESGELIFTPSMTEADIIAKVKELENENYKMLHMSYAELCEQNGGSVENYMKRYSFGKGERYMARQKGIEALNEKLPDGKKVHSSAVALELRNGKQIKYNEVKKLSDSLTTDEIVARLGGGDLTKGSCSSLAFAYSGEKGGLDVLDFRGGDSLDFFSRNSNIQRIANIEGVSSKIVEVKNEISGATQLLQTMTDGKEYYLAVGKHAAIVRHTEEYGYQYLELQSAYDNGWHTLTSDKLRSRFGAAKSRTIYGNKVNSKVVMIDTDSLASNSEFQEILGYLNTAADAQKKGVRGHVR